MAEVHGSSADDERTILAGRLRAADDMPAPAAELVAAPDMSLPVLRAQGLPLRAGRGLNPLVHAASPLLDLVVPLRFLVEAPEVEVLRVNLVRAIKNFEAEARGAHVDSQAIAVARYVLCTFLDETIAGTAWGGGGVWASRSLLVAFHNEAWGGEKFFQILQRLAQDPGPNLQVLELLYLCMALGLEGRYRVAEGGRAQVEGLRERLQKIIQLQRGPAPRALSPHWQPGDGKRMALFAEAPLWSTAAAVFLLILLVRFALSFALSARSEPLAARMDALRGYGAPVVVAGPAPAAPAQAPAEAPNIATFLAPEIEHGFVRVAEGERETVVTLLGSGVFASASDEVMPAFRPIVERIGAALRTVEGPVTVSGHSDDQPVKLPRFASNGELSLARAEAVKALLEKHVHTPGRLQAEGRADSEPLVPNDSAENRARNRRVEIHIRHPQQAAGLGSKP